MEDWLTAYKIPLGKWIAGFVDFLNDHAACAFNAISDGLGFLIDGLIELMQRRRRCSWSRCSRRSRTGCTARSGWWRWSWSRCCSS